MFTPSRPRKASRILCLEPLEDRCVLSGDVVLHWNQLALDAIRQVKPNPLVASRALAIEQVAVYDAVNAIDQSFTPYFAHVQASHGASLEAPAARTDTHPPPLNAAKAPRPRHNTPRPPRPVQIALFRPAGAGPPFAFGHLNEIAAVASVNEGLDLVQNARLFALLNIATADAL